VKKVLHKNADVARYPALTMTVSQHIKAMPFANEIDSIPFPVLLSIS
jgi:hypothetical protein